MRSCEGRADHLHRGLHRGHLSPGLGELVDEQENGGSPLDQPCRELVEPGPADAGSEADWGGRRGPAGQVGEGLDLLVRLAGQVRQVQESFERGPAAAQKVAQCWMGHAGGAGPAGEGALEVSIQISCVHPGQERSEDRIIARQQDIRIERRTRNKPELLLEYGCDRPCGGTMVGTSLRVLRRIPSDLSHELAVETHVLG